VAGGFPARLGDGDRPGVIAAADLARRLPLTGRDTTDINVEGDAGLAQRWWDNTAHVSG
jgi:hypothetical protein